MKNFSLIAILLSSLSLYATDMNITGITCRSDQQIGAHALFIAQNKSLRTFLDKEVSTRSEQLEEPEKKLLQALHESFKSFPQQGLRASMSEARTLWLYQSMNIKKIAAGTKESQEYLHDAEQLSEEILQIYTRALQNTIDHSNRSPFSFLDLDSIDLKTPTSQPQRKMAQSLTRAVSMSLNKLLQQKKQKSPKRLQSRYGKK